MCVCMFGWHAMQKVNGEREHVNVYADIKFSDITYSPTYTL